MDGQSDKTCFFLRPLEERAAAIVSDPANTAWRCPDPTSGARRWVLRIGFDQPSKTPGILASFGRIEAINDIVLRGRTYGKIQCYFTVHSKTGEILLHDKSRFRSTHLLLDVDPGDHWQNTPKRGVVILSRGSSKFTIGRARFQLMPYDNGTGILRQNTLEFVKRNPADDPYADTSDEEEMAPMPPEHDAKIKGPSEEEISHLDIRSLGRGTFGQVKEVVDLYNGDHYAAKSIPWEGYVKLHYKTEKAWKEKVLHEVKLHRSLSHEHIVKYISSQGWQLGQQVKIFMPLYSGDCMKLFWHNKMHDAQREPLVNKMVRQMLLALEYIHNQRMVHRDIKPANILFQENGENFYLCDFGFAKYVNNTNSCVGTDWYRAPEVTNRKTQSTKVDIYSLGATILECCKVLPDAKDRPNMTNNTAIWHKYLQWRSNNCILLATNPEDRPSAKSCIRNKALHTVRLAPLRAMTGKEPELKVSPEAQKPDEPQAGPAMGGRVGSAYSVMDYSMQLKPDAVEKRLIDPTPKVLVAPSPAKQDVGIKPVRDDNRHRRLMTPSPTPTPAPAPAFTPTKDDIPRNPESSLDNNSPSPNGGKNKRKLEPQAHRPLKRNRLHLEDDKGDADICVDNNNKNKQKREDQPRRPLKRRRSDLRDNERHVNAKPQNDNNGNGGNDDLDTQDRKKHRPKCDDGLAEYTARLLEYTTSLKPEERYRIFLQMQQQIFGIPEKGGHDRDRA